jgi:hypothetical protein
MRNTTGKSGWMRPGLLMLGLAWLAGTATGRARGDAPPPDTVSAGEMVVAREARPVRVGQLFIIGNATVPQEVILREVFLYPGALLDPNALGSAARNLANLNLFETDVQGKLSPVVRILDNDVEGEYRDILIQVQEKPTASLQCRIADTARALAAWYATGAPTALVALYAPE